MKLYRQGDVLVQRVKKQNVEFRPATSHVLRHGTTTRHSHVATGDFGLAEVNSETYLRVTATPIAILHEEHGTINLPKGDYKVIIQEQYSPSGYRKVVD